MVWSASLCLSLTVAWLPCHPGQRCRMQRRRRCRCRCHGVHTEGGMRVRGVGDKESIPANPTRAPPRSGRFVLPRCVGADAGASADGDGWRNREWTKQDNTPDNESGMTEYHYQDVCGFASPYFEYSDLGLLQMCRTMQNETRALLATGARSCLGSARCCCHAIGWRWRQHDRQRQVGGGGSRPSTTTAAWVTGRGPRGDSRGARYLYPLPCPAAASRRIGTVMGFGIRPCIKAAPRRSNYTRAPSWLLPLPAGGPLGRLRVGSE